MKSIEIARIFESEKTKADPLEWAYQTLCTDMQMLGTMFMGILDKLFTRKEKQKWEVLKLYSSVSRDRPSSIHRERLVHVLLRAFEGCYGQKPTLLDIHGPYGISKGRPVGVKRFMNLLQSKGYDKFYALTMSDKNHEACIHFMDTAHELDKTGRDFGYEEIIIGHKSPLYSCDLLKMSAEIYQVFQFDYGYITQLPSNFDLIDESKTKKSMGITDWAWRSNTNKILTGAIKDVYSTNLLNDRQADKIRQLGLDAANFNDKIFLWNVEENKLQSIRDQMKGELIINTVPNKSYMSLPGLV